MRCPKLRLILLGEVVKVFKYILHGRLFIAGLFLALPLVAQETKPGDKMRAELTYEKFYRLNNPVYRSDSGDWLGLSYEYKPSPEHTFSAGLEGDLRFYFQDDNAFNYSLQEAYLIYRGDDYRLTLGRKILDWNINEKYWSLGYLNALQSFTLLSTEEEGVTGLLFNKTIGPFEFDVLVSYIFVPQINPSVNFKNGEVRSRSEWVRLPPRKTVKDGLEVPIYYHIIDYQVEKIVFNKSLGANIRYAWNKEGGLSAFAIYKPENKLRINASGYYDVNAHKAEVTADPTINHHAYYGIQIYQAFGDVKARGGLSYVDPNARLGKDLIINARKTFESKYFNINPRYDKEAYAHMSLNLDRKDYKLTLNYIHLISSNIRGSDDFFSDTVKWKSTFGGGIEYYFNDSFDVAFDLKYDLVRKDNILKGEVKYNYNHEVNIALGLEVLKAPDDNSYWSYYRTADTLYSTIGFVL